MHLGEILQDRGAGWYGQDVVYVFIAVPNVTFMQPMVSIVPSDEVWLCLTN